MKARKRRFTHGDVAFIRGLMAQGVKPSFIAVYVYGITKHQLFAGLKSWKSQRQSVSPSWVSLRVHTQQSCSLTPAYLSLEKNKND